MSGELLALFSALLFAFASVAIRIGLRGEPRPLDNGMLMTTLINSAVFGLLLMASVLAGAAPPLIPEGVALFAVAGLLTTFVGRSSLYASIRRIGPARASGYKVTTPLFAVAFGAMILGEVVTPLTVGGIAVTMVGLFMLFREVQSRAPLDPDGGNALTGSSLALMSATSFAAGLAVRKAGLSVIASPIAGAAIGSFVALGSVVITFALRREVSRIMHSNLNPVRWWFVVAGTVTCCAQLAGFAALSLATVGSVATIQTAEPVFAMMLSRFILKTDEAITAATARSLLMVCGGITLLVLIA